MARLPFLNPVTDGVTNVGERLALAVVLVAISTVSLLLVSREPVFLLAVAALGGLLTLLVLRPDSGSLIFLGFAYLNLPVVVGKAFGSPQLIGALSMGFVFVPILVHVLIRRRGPVLDFSFLFMLAFLASILISSLGAVDTRLAFKWVTTFILEGLLIYLLIINGIRSVATLRAAMWTMIFAGSLLGGISLYQEMTGSYDQQFGGLVKRNTEEMQDADMTGGSLKREREKVRLGHRAGGPTGGPGRFAQILIVLLPLAGFRIRDEKTRPLKILAAVGTFLILCGVLLTYSRATFLCLIPLAGLLIFLRYIKLQHALLCGLAVGIGLTIVAPGYLNRIDSIRVVPSLLSSRETTKADGATRGRLTEMLAAFHAFLDHPILGVGPGQYTPFYSVKYMENPDIAFRSIAKNRRSHCLYSELAAEVGLSGFLAFMGILLLICWRLWRLRCRFLVTRPELSNMAMAFLLGVLAYLMTAIFLQLAYQRYLWIIVGLAGAAVQILNQQSETPEDA